MKTKDKIEKLIVRTDGLAREMQKDLADIEKNMSDSCIIDESDAIGIYNKAANALKNSYRAKIDELLEFRMELMKARDSS